MTVLFEMSIFSSKKSKAKKAEIEAKAKAAADDKPKPAPYKHVPKHAASDSANVADRDRAAQKAQIAAASHERLLRPDSHMSNPSYVRTLTQASINGAPSPSQNRLGVYNAGSFAKTKSTEVFIADPDAPPMPTSSTLAEQTALARGGVPRANDGYFNTRTKTPSALHEDPHRSADSGYGSTIHSRAPSEHNYLSDPTKPHLAHSDNGFLPELSLSEELAREPAFSEHSFDGMAEEPLPKRITGSMLKNKAKRNAVLLSPEAPRPAKSSLKQARFETPEPVVSREPEPHTSEDRVEQQTFPAETQQSSRGLPRVEDAQPQPAPEIESPTRHYYSGFKHDDGTTPFRPSVPKAVQRPNMHSGTTTSPTSTKAPDPLPPILPEPRYVPARTSTPPLSAREYEPQNTMQDRYSLPPPQSHFMPPERIVSPFQQDGGLPSISILEGLKINKRGKILDEEGDVIGELQTGDIMDCVRQRVNGYGEVLDDYGSVVGSVRTLPRGQASSPVSRMSAPAPMRYGQQYNFQAYSQNGQQRSASPVNMRRESITSQQSVFTPAWQTRNTADEQPYLAQELRNHLATAPTSSTSAIAPIDFPGHVTHVELEAGETAQYQSQQNDDDELPIMDYSDVFMPAPFVPARSPRRETPPSPPTEKAEQRFFSRARVHSPSPQATEEVTRPQSMFSRAPAAQKAVPVIIQEEVAASVAQLRLSLNTTGHSTLVEQQQPRVIPAKALSRSASDSVAADAAKSYVRPSMSPVPEDGTIQDTSADPSAFTYKGDIPAANGPSPMSMLAPPRSASKAPGPFELCEAREPSRWKLVLADELGPVLFCRRRASQIQHEHARPKTQS